MKKCLMPLYIQMFAENMDEGSAANETNIDADNIETTDNTSNDVDNSEQEVQVKNSTKEYSERLKKDREKIRQEIEEEYKLKNDNLAKARGYENWAELEEASNRELLEGLGVNDTEEFNKYLKYAIDNNPAIIEANNIINNQKKAEAERQLQADVAEISKLDPTIKDVNDLLAHPSYDRVYEKVQNGMSILDAYKLENFEALTNRTSAAAVSHAVNNIENKSHMGTISGNASKDVAIPTEVLEMYKAFNPNMTEEQIRNDYSSRFGGK